MSSILKIHSLILLATAIACFTQPSSAQQASVTYFGPTCGPPSPYGQPTIQSSIPKIGGPWTITSTDMRVVREPRNSCEHGGIAMLALGTSNSHWGGINLPFQWPLSLTRVTGCWALTSADFMVPIFFDAAGSSMHGFIPNDTSLLGVSLFAQIYIRYWTVWQLSCPFVLEPYIVTSNAAHLTIGF